MAKGTKVSRAIAGSDESFSLLTKLIKLEMMK